MGSIAALSPLSHDATTWTLQHHHSQRVTATKAAGSYSLPTEAGGEDLQRCECQERRFKVEFNVKQQSSPLYNSRKLMRGSECLIEVDVEKQESQSPGDRYTETEQHCKHGIATALNDLKIVLSVSSKLKKVVVSQREK